MNWRVKENNTTEGKRVAVSIGTYSAPVLPAQKLALNHGAQEQSNPALLESPTEPPLHLESVRAHGLRGGTGASMLRALLGVKNFPEHSSP